jgi:hypothetical protein
MIHPVKIFNRWSLCSGLILNIVVSSPSFAEEIFKVVDDDGNVSYSTEKPEYSQTAKIIETLPAPTEEDVQAAQNRLQKIEERDEKLSLALTEQMQREAERRNSNTTIVLQPGYGGIATPFITPYYHTRWWGGTPGHRPPSHRPPSIQPPNRPRPPVNYPSSRQTPIVNRNNG